MDRFMMRIKIGYPETAAEKEILLSPSAKLQPNNLEPVLSVGEVIYIQDMVDKIKIDHDLVDYILAIVNATRKSDKLQLGVSPRGAMALYRAAQASALVDGRTYCIPDDIKRLFISVFSHRVVASPGLEGETEDVEGIIQEMVENIEVPL